MRDRWPLAGIHAGSLAFLEISLCVLAMWAGSVLDRLYTGMPAARLCGGYPAIDVGTVLNRMEFVARTMPFMLLAGALAAGGFALVSTAKPLSACLNASLMLTAMIVGHALAMGMGPLAEWIGSIVGMVAAHCLVSAAAPPRRGNRVTPSDFQPEMRSA